MARQIQRKKIIARQIRRNEIIARQIRRNNNYVPVRRQNRKNYYKNNYRTVVVTYVVC